MWAPFGAISIAPFDHEREGKWCFVTQGWGGVGVYILKMVTSGHQLTLTQVRLKVAEMMHRRETLFEGRIPMWPWVNPLMTKSLNIWLNTQFPWASPSVLIIALLIFALQFVHYLMSRKYTQMWHIKILSIYLHQRAPRLCLFTQNYNNIEVSNIIVIKCNI